MQISKYFLHATEVPVCEMPGIVNTLNDRYMRIRKGRAYYGIVGWKKGLSMCLMLTGLNQRAMMIS